MTKPKALLPEAERELEWVDNRYHLPMPNYDRLPAWSEVMDHLASLLAALPPAIEFDDTTGKVKINDRRRRVASKRYFKTAYELHDRLHRKHARHVRALVKLERAYLKWKEDNPHQIPTRKDLAIEIARAKGVDVDDPFSFEGDEAAHSIGKILRKNWWSWPEFKRFMESEPEGPKLENWLNESKPEGPDLVN